MTRPKMPDWRTEPSQIDWKPLKYAATMSRSQTGVVDRMRQQGVELSRPISANSPGGLAQDYVARVKNGAPAYTAKLVDPAVFLALRAKGLTLAQIVRKLAVSKSTIDRLNRELTND